MREATGEFSMTVVTILAIIVIVTLVGWLGPRITTYVHSIWGSIAECPEGQTLNDEGACVFN